MTWEIWIILSNAIKLAHNSTKQSFKSFSKRKNSVFRGAVVWLKKTMWVIKAKIHFSPNKETRTSFFLTHTNTHTQRPLNSLLDVALILSATIINKQINHLDGICVRGPSGLCENEWGLCERNMKRGRAPL